MGIEPITYHLQGGCSAELSYVGRIIKVHLSGANYTKCRGMEQDGAPFPKTREFIRCVEKRQGKLAQKDKRPAASTHGRAYDWVINNQCDSTGCGSSPPARFPEP
jgi:hypothetical protein